MKLPKVNKETQHEIDFIASLGTNTEQAAGEPGARERLLEGYLAGCAKRTAWARIDRSLVIQCAHQALLAF